MTRLTSAQQTALARMSDGEWYRGHEMEAAPNVIAALHNRGLIRGADDGRFGIRAENWTITPSGLMALEGASA